jgi:trimeric autotransporter adhesin
MRLSSCRVPMSLGLLALSPMIGLTGCMNRSLTAIEIAPAVDTVGIGVGQTAQFTATGVYTESGHETTTEDMTNSVTWSSSVTGVATISSSGLATGTGGGVSVITASIPGAYGPLTASSNITVTASSSSGGSGSGSGGTTAPRALTTVTIIPGSQTLSTVGETSQFLAIGTYNEAPTSANLTNLVTWQSSDTTVAQVSSTGLVTGEGVGTATISALATGPDGSVIAGSGTVTVSNPVSSRALIALNVSPGSQTLTTAGEQAQFIAIGTYNSAPLSADLTDSVTWQSSDTSIATVNSSGVVTAVGAGTATITALGTGSSGSVVTAAGAVTVLAEAPTTRILTSLTVIPSSQTLTGVGQTASFLAIGTYSAAPLTANLTSSVSWQTSTSTIATVNSSGVVTAAGGGTATITAVATASDGSIITATGTVSVTTSTTVRQLTGLVISPGAQTLTALGQTASLQAYGSYNTSPTSANLTTTSQWTSSDTAVATVGASTGVVTAVGEGSTTINVQATGPDGSVLNATATVTVTVATTSRILTSLSVIPGTQTVNAIGETVQYLAIGTYSAAPLTEDLTSQVTWVSSDTTIASVADNGVATGQGAGTATISAVGTASDGSSIVASGTLTETDAATGTVALPILDVYLVGNGSGTVTYSTTIDCTTGNSGTCAINVTPGTIVTLTAAPGTGSVFSGWSGNCTPVTGTPTECTITVNGNETVGAIFDPQ